MISIDGSFLEGGGQVVRTALALSSLTQIPVEIHSVRAQRNPPGLKHQHLHCIYALQKLCAAKAKGAELQSESVEYSPSSIDGGTISIDIQTSGSIALVLQAVLLPALFASKKVRLQIKGGTCGLGAMPIEFFIHIIEPQLRRFVNSIETKILKRGYYPKGGGQVEIQIAPKLARKDFETLDSFFEELKNQVEPIDLSKRSHLIQIKGISYASADLESGAVAERQAKAAKHLLSKYNVPVHIAHEYQDTLSTGSGIVVWAIFSHDKEEINSQKPIILGADALGERGAQAEQVGAQAAQKLAKLLDSPATVDTHTQDTIIPFLGLVGGSLRVEEMTLHTQTNIWVTEQFLGKRFSVANGTIDAKPPQSL